MEILGRGYIIGHCMDYMRKKMDERRYRVYVTDALMAIAENSSRFNGGMTMTGHWVDNYKPEETRTTEEIIADVIKNAGLK